MNEDILKGPPELEIRETLEGYEIILDGRKLEGVLDYKIIKSRGKPHEFNVTLAVKLIANQKQQQ